MGKLNFPVISIAPATGSTTTISSSGTAVAIPPMSNGDLPKYVFCVATGGTAGAFVTMEPKTSAVIGAIGTGLPLVTDSGIPVILNVHGYSHIGCDSTVSDIELRLYPLEDF